MQPIEGKLYSPFQKKVHHFTMRKMLEFETRTELVWERMDATVNKIRASEGFPVKTFRDLVNEVANVTLSNKKFEMYYRGQRYDYKNNQGAYYKDRKPKTVIYSPICRPDKKDDGTYKYSIRKELIGKRYDDLYNMVEIANKGKRSYYPEYFYSLFQHYQILPTPLIDITQSLRVAATFALRNSSTGYLYVFGLPYPNQSISYFRDLEIVLIKLQNITPIAALRPRYQEGFLVGKYPMLPTKKEGDDLANRLVAKFYLDNKKGNFWDEYFLSMPDEILYPKNDKVEEQLLKYKAEFDEKYKLKSKTKK